MGSTNRNNILRRGQRSKEWLRRTIVTGLLLFAFAAGAAKFTTTVDRDRILVGETVTLTLSFEEASISSMPQIPKITGLQQVGQMGSSFNSTLGADGRMHTVSSFSVTLQATQTGDLQIPAFQLDLAGQKVTSQPIALKVMEEDKSGPPAEMGQLSAFLWLALPKKEFYVGETFVPELRLYVRAGVQRIAGFEPPPLQTEGLAAGRWQSASGNYVRRVGNRQFTVFSMSCAATPVKTGPLKAGPLNASVTLNPPDFFDQIRGYRPNSEQVPLNLEAVPFQVMPLPTQNVPPGFAGAVGDFTMTVSAGPTNVATGDPITLRVQISGRGALDAVALPNTTAWDGFKTYPAVSKTETTDALAMQGTKSFEQIVSAESVSVKELPAFSFSFFNPETKQYRTLTQAALPLTVRPGTAAVMPTVTATPEKTATTPPPSQDIVHIKPRPGSLLAIAPPLIQQAWFIAVQSVPVLAWLAMVGFRRRADSLARNPRLRRQREVAQAVREHLKALSNHAAANDSDAFFATLFRLLQEQLGERLDCPASAITEEVIEEKLRPRGAPDALLQELHSLFQLCNQARYAPIKSSQELAALIPRVENLVRELQALPA